MKIHLVDLQGASWVAKSIDAALRSQSNPVGLTQKFPAVTGV